MTYNFQIYSGNSNQNHVMNEFEAGKFWAVLLIQKEESKKLIDSIRNPNSTFDRDKVLTYWFDESRTGLLIHYHLKSLIRNILWNTNKIVKNKILQNLSVLRFDSREKQILYNRLNI